MGDSSFPSETTVVRDTRFQVHVWPEGFLRWEVTIRSDGDMPAKKVVIRGTMGRAVRRAKRLLKQSAREHALNDWERYMYDELEISIKATRNSPF